MSDLRLIASQILDDIQHGQSLAKQHLLSSITHEKDRAFVQAIVFGVCREYFHLQAITQVLIKKPLTKENSQIQALILVGLYQLKRMRVPQHAAVSETVKAAKKIKKKPWAPGFVNAILQNYLRQKEKIEASLTQEEAVFNHPKWWIDKIKKSWPKAWQDILHASNVHPPFSLRVNLRAISRENYLRQLEKLGLVAKMIPETNAGITLESPSLTKKLPGFADGKVWVQDGAAQLAAPLLALAKGQHVLDACSAPGGKLMHILECEPDLARVTAVEKDPARFKLLKENLAKHPLYRQCHCILGDVNRIDRWWDGERYDRILIDAPCSGSGVVRRHPDIKLLRRSKDIPAFVRQQMQLLKTLWPLLKPGGLLLYVTCSIFPEENVGVIKKFLAQTPDAGEEKIKSHVGFDCEIGRQILTGMHEMDGFYYALLRRL